MKVDFNTSRKPTCGSKSKSLLADRNTNQTETIASVRRSFLQASAVHVVPWVLAICPLFAKKAAREHLFIYSGIF